MNAVPPGPIGGPQAGPPGSQPVPPPGPPQPGQENLNALQRSIDLMEEKGMQEDPRYSQLLILRAKQGNMEAPRPVSYCDFSAHIYPVFFFSIFEAKGNKKKILSVLASIWYSKINLHLSKNTFKL